MIKDYNYNYNVYDLTYLQSNFFLNAECYLRNSHY